MLSITCWSRTQGWTHLSEHPSIPRRSLPRHRAPRCEVDKPSATVQWMQNKTAHFFELLTFSACGAKGWQHPSISARGKSHAEGQRDRVFFSRTDCNTTTPRSLSAQFFALSPKEHPGVSAVGTYTGNQPTSNLPVPQIHKIKGKIRCSMPTWLPTLIHQVRDETSPGFRGSGRREGQGIQLRDLVASTP